MEFAFDEGRCWLLLSEHAAIFQATSASRIDSLGGFSMSHDNQLKQDVLAELGWEPSVTAAHIGVTARAGVVTLTGYVESFAQKHAAEAAVCRVKGVKAVAEEIEVRLPFHINKGDEEIAVAAVGCLEWDVSVPVDTVKVEVDKGWITLSGEVDWNYEKEAAELDVRRLLGLVGVTNRITINPKVRTRSPSHDIRNALHRTWLDPQTIEVSAQGGNIRLTGTVNSLHDRQTAEATAWAAPGATSVENDIAVI
jgi:osmotically-inducible protein OsmY